MTVAFWPPTKGGTMKTRTLIMPPDESWSALRAKRLRYQDGDAVYEQAVMAMMLLYELDMETILALGEAAGKCSTAVRLLKEGMPTDYILAMGGS